MNRDLKIGEKKLNDLIEYINKCNFCEDVLYEKSFDTFSYLGAYYDYIDKKSLNDEQKVVLKCCSVLNNIFKHKKEINGKIDELKIIKYGTDLSSCILNAPFGDVIFFTNSSYLENLKDKNNYNYYNKYLNNQRFDFFLEKVKKVVGELYE